MPTPAQTTSPSFITRADPAEQRAHRLAAALLYRLSGMAHQLANAQQAISRDMQATIGSAGLPATLAQVIRVAEQVDGVRLGGLITALEPDARAAEDALARILRDAEAMSHEDDTARIVQEWDHVITGVIAACHGARHAIAQLHPFLDQLAANPVGTALVAVVRRILDGERGTGS